MRTPEYRASHITEMLSWPLEKKIIHTLNRIIEFYEARNGKVFVAFSGGLDSTVLLHMVRLLYPDVKAVFGNTTNEYSEILEFIRTVDNVVWLNPAMNFIDIVKAFGFPLVSKKVCRSIHDLRNPTDENFASRNLYLTGIKRDGSISKSFKLAKRWLPLIESEFDITGKCCDILKKNPMKKYERETGEKPFVGTLAEESEQRRIAWIQTGCNSFRKGAEKSTPLAIWTQKDIWEYIRLYDVAYSSAYDPVINEKGEVVCSGEKRTGCAYCAFGLHLQNKTELNRFQRLAIRKPKQHEKMMNLKNNGITYREALRTIGVNPDIKDHS